jgi:hypothetical protein
VFVSELIIYCVRKDSEMSEKDMSAFAGKLSQLVSGLADMESKQVEESMQALRSRAESDKPVSLKPSEEPEIMGVAQRLSAVVGPEALQQAADGLVAFIAEVEGEWPGQMLQMLNALLSLVQTKLSRAVEDEE